MRSFFLLGGFVGFCVAAFSGMAAGHPGDRLLLDGSVGCLVGAMLFRFFWSQLVRVLTDTVRAKRVARAAAEEAAAAAAKPAAAQTVKSR